MLEALYSFRELVSGVQMERDLLEAWFWEIFKVLLPV